MEDYSKLIAECLAELEEVPPMTAAERAYMERCAAAMDECYAQENPTPCRRDKNCVCAGGCYHCLVIRPGCRETDRLMNRAAWEKGIFGPARTAKERARHAEAKRAPDDLQQLINSLTSPPPASPRVQKAD
jgi:hypothetical protein